jgi:hypothetical protein
METSRNDRLGRLVNSTKSVGFIVMAKVGFDIWVGVVDNFKRYLNQFFGLRVVISLYAKYVYLKQS